MKRLKAAAALAITLGSAQAVVLSPTDDTSGTLTFSGTTVTKRTHTSANGTSGSLPVAFGTDAMGTIGSPTTVNSNDLAGVTFSALQQLAKENETLKAQHADYELQFQQFHEKLEILNARLEGSVE